MDKESLKTARKLILSSVDNSVINIVDRVELIINLDKFLSEDNYEDNIKILRKENAKNKR